MVFVLARVFLVFRMNATLFFCTLGALTSTNHLAASHRPSAGCTERAHWPPSVSMGNATLTLLLRCHRHVFLLGWFGHSLLWGGQLSLSRQEQKNRRLEGQLCRPWGLKDIFCFCSFQFKLKPIYKSVVHISRFLSQSKCQNVEPIAAH